MTTRRVLREAKRRRSRKIKALLAAGVVFGVGSGATLAAWNDSEYGAATFTAGTFTIVSRDGAGSFTDHGPGEEPLIVPFEATGLYPGQKRAALVQVQAGGTVGGSLTLDAVDVTDADGEEPEGSDLALRDDLIVGVKVTDAESANPPSCDVSTEPDATVTGLHNVPLLGSYELLASGGNTISYCIIVELPSTSGNDAQGGELRAYWTFRGTSD